MKTVNLAIASIVDANTGNGVNPRFIEQYVSTASSYEQRGREIRAKSLMAIYGKLKASFKQYIEDIRARAQQRREIEVLSQLSDRVLEDIGLTQADLYDLRSGQVTLKALGARRELRLRQATGEQLSLVPGSVGASLRNIGSANQENYEAKKCA